MNDEDEHPGEQGFVTPDLLRRNLPGELTDYQFLICGAPPMVLSLKDSLAEAGVPRVHIHYELFST